MNFWSAVKQVWTIARHSVLQAVRMRVVLVLAVFLLVLVPTLPFLLTTQNTRVERLQMVITYCIYLLSFLLGILTLFLSANTLNLEIKNQHIFMLDPKPLRRGVLLIGKWCGVMLIDLILLAVMLGATYGVVRYMARPPIPGLRARAVALKQQQWDALQASHTPEQTVLISAIEHRLQILGEQLEEQARVDTEVLTAREVGRPQSPNITDEVNSEYEKLKAQNLLPADKSEAWEKARIQDWLSRWDIPPAQQTTWWIHGIPKLKKGSVIVIQFRHLGDGTSGDYSIPGEILVNEGGQPTSRLQGRFAINKFHTLAVPAEEVLPDGSLKITYTNLDAGQEGKSGMTAHFPYEDGIKVLYPVASLAENFARAGLVILMRLTFIAIVGIFASTFLSYPVAALMNMLFFVVGYLAFFIFGYLVQNTYIFGSSMVPPWSPLNRLDALFRWCLSALFSLFPNYSQFTVVPDLSGGILISAALILKCFFWVPLLRGGVLAVAAWVIFNRRELAALSPSA